MTTKSLSGALAPAYREHKLSQGENGDYNCSVCEWTWNKRPLPHWECPGVKRYEWGKAPHYLKTAKQLKEHGVKPGKRRGCFVTHKFEAIYLYDIREARPRPQRPK